MVSVTLWIYFVPDLMAASLSSTSELGASTVNERERGVRALR
jgi:hypothetical protein